MPYAFAAFDLVLGAMLHHPGGDIIPYLAADKCDLAGGNILANCNAFAYVSGCFWRLISASVIIVTNGTAGNVHRY